jgi:hypothetical protein
MKNLSEYVKKSKLEKFECVQTSVNISTHHRQFISEYNLNLSEMVRDMLDSMILKESKSTIKPDIDL